MRNIMILMMNGTAYTLADLKKWLRKQMVPLTIIGILLLCWGVLRICRMIINKSWSLP